MIKKKVLLDYIDASKLKLSDKMSKAVQALPEQFHIVQLGDALLKADGVTQSEGAMLAMAFSQHLLDQADAKPAKPAVKKVHTPTEPPPRDRPSVGASSALFIDAGAQVVAQRTGRW